MRTMANKLPDKFLEFLKTFNKNPGEYTEDELEEIGIYHQSFERWEKNWNDVVALLGVTNKTGEQFRKWVLARRYQKGLVEKNPKVLDDKTIDEVTNEDVSDSLEGQRQALIKAKMQLRDERTDFNRTLRAEARLDRFIQTIQSLAKDYSVLPTVVNTTFNTDIQSCEAVYGLADLHLGPVVENYANTYNYEEAVKRVNKIAEDVIYYCNLHNVHTLHFINMGDLIAGIIHPTIRLEQEYDVIEQVIRVAELVAEMLNTLQQAAPVVTYRSVVDNHARITPDKHQHIELENLNRIIDIFVKERLKDTSIQFPDDNLDIGIGRIELETGKKLFFMHGHEDKKTSVVQDLMGLTHEFPDYILMAHFHNSAVHTFQGAKLFISGSVIGTDSYAFGKRLFSQPEQKLLIFDNRNNVIDFDIRCKE